MSDLSGTYMGMAILMAKNSKANRAKVGAILVTSSGVILPAYNGTPMGDDNRCEDDQNVTLPTVVHAETNAILKAAREGVSVVDAELYVTLSPCLRCAAMLIQSGIKKVIYKDVYRDDSSINYLQRNGIQTIQIETECITSRAISKMETS